MSNMQGVIGAYTKKDVARKAYYILYGVQHRGQESAGISAAGDHSLRTWKGKGLVSKVFDERYRSFMHPDDYVAIGCASGTSPNRGIIPPIVTESERFEISMAVDGYIPSRRDKLNEEALASLIMNQLERQGDIELVISRVMNDLPDSYFSLVMAIYDKDSDSSELVSARDKRGIRPLYIGLNDEELFIASESAPIDVLEKMCVEIDERRDFPPGSIIRRSDEGFFEKQILKPQPAYCAFEWAYFGRPDSVIGGKNVHAVRKRLGHARITS